MILAGLNVAVAHQMYLYGQENTIQGPLAGGLSVAIGIYMCANVSGGHVNPAVTLAFWTLGRLGNNFFKNTLMMFWYWAAQTAGAFISALIVYLVYFDAETPSNGEHPQNNYDMVCIYATCPTRLYEISHVSIDYFFPFDYFLGLFLAILLRFFSLKIVRIF